MTKLLVTFRKFANMPKNNKMLFLQGDIPNRLQS